MVDDKQFLLIQGWQVGKGLKGNELLLYALIYGFCQDGRSCFRGSLNYMADWLNVTRQTVINTLNLLVERGLIVKSGTKECPEYTVSGGSQKFLPPQSKILTPPVKNFDPPIGIDNIEDNIDKENTIKENQDNEIEAAFSVFWDIYPGLPQKNTRKGSRLGALKAYIRCVKRNGIKSIPAILEGAKSYAVSAEVSRGFGKGCEAWLNGDRFLWTYAPAPTDKQKTSGPVSIGDIMDPNKEVEL